MEKSGLKKLSVFQIIIDAVSFIISCDVKPYLFVYFLLFWIHRNIDKITLHNKCILLNVTDRIVWTKNVLSAISCIQRDFNIIIKSFLNRTLKKKYVVLIKKKKITKYFDLLFLQYLMKTKHHWLIDLFSTSYDDQNLK